MTAAALVLASASTARRAVLEGAGLDFSICPAEIDEARIRDRGLAQGTPPDRIARALAVEKARSVAARTPGAIVLGSDQILVARGRLFSKPDDRSSARDQLCQLRGRAHTLISAAALCRDGALLWDHAETARLTMRDFSDAFLDDYLDRAGDGILASVGAYHLEGLGAQLFDSVEGDYFTVLGLPLLAVLQALRDIGYLTS